MKSFYMIIFLLFITISSLDANDDNNISSTDDNRTWHFGLTGGYGSYAWSATLYAEKSFEGHSAMFIDTEVEVTNKNSEIIGSGLGIQYIYYNDEDAYFFEGLYYSAGIGMNHQKFFDYGESLNYDASTVVGYGWHFFNNFLLIRLYTGVEYSYNIWNNIDVGPEYIYSGSKGRFDYIFSAGMAFVF